MRWRVEHKSHDECIWFNVATNSDVHLFQLFDSTNKTQVKIGKLVFVLDYRDAGTTHAGSTASIVFDLTPVLARIPSVIFGQHFCFPGHAWCLHRPFRMSPRLLAQLLQEWNWKLLPPVIAMQASSIPKVACWATRCIANSPKSMVPPKLGVDSLFQFLESTRENEHVCFRRLTGMIIFHFSQMGTICHY